MGKSSRKAAIGEKTVALNRRAGYEYFLEERVEAGIALTGAEVKSIRAGNVSIQDAFGRAENGELWLYGMHVAPWDPGSHFIPDSKRKRKLLLKKMEIVRLMGKISARGFSLIPTRVYFKRGWAKVELALAKGKKLYDKRQALRAKEAGRDIERTLRGRE